MNKKITSIKDLGSINTNYKLILCDAWGVLHNGLKADPEAVECLKAARTLGAYVVIVTNAPRTEVQLIEYFTQLGIDPLSYNGIISSGQVARDLLFKDRPGKIYHLGPPVDQALFVGLEPDVVLCLNEADIIINTGLRDNTREKVEDYEDFLEAALKKNIPMICVNPDKFVLIGEDRRACAGAIAAIYESIGGEVRWIGKPYREIYEASELHFQEHTGKKLTSRECLVIGDAIHTDILGGNNIGSDTLFIYNGVQASELRQAGIAPDNLEDLESFCSARGAMPKYILKDLR